MIIAKSQIQNQVIKIEKAIIKRFLQGKEIKPFAISPSNKIVIIPYELKNGKIQLIKQDEMRLKYPYCFSYFSQNKTFLENRENGRMKTKNWYAYIYPKNIEFMGQTKILIPDIASSASFAIDEKGEYAFTSGYGITLKTDVDFSLKYVLGLLNSKLLDFYLKNISTVMRGGYIRFFSQYIENLPICTINFSDPADKARHDELVALVERMLALHRKKGDVKTDHEKNLIERQIEVTDRQIDNLVYELYELTEEEIRIVEDAA